MERGWIVSGETGEYSDWRTWPVAIFTEKPDAEAFAAECNRLAADAERGANECDDWSVDYLDAAKANGLTKLDPKTSHSYAGTSYCVTEAPWFRSWKAPR